MQPPLCAESDPLGIDPRHTGCGRRYCVAVKVACSYAMLCHVTKVRPHLLHLLPARREVAETPLAQPLSTCTAARWLHGGLQLRPRSS